MQWTTPEADAPAHHSGAASSRPQCTCAMKPASYISLHSAVHSAADCCSCFLARPRLSAASAVPMCPLRRGPQTTAGRLQESAVAHRRRTGAILASLLDFRGKPGQASAGRHLLALAAGDPATLQGRPSARRRAPSAARSVARPTLKDDGHRAHTFALPMCTMCSSGRNVTGGGGREACVQRQAGLFYNPSRAPQPSRFRLIDLADHRDRPTSEPKRRPLGNMPT